MSSAATRSPLSRTNCSSVGEGVAEAVLGARLDDPHHPFLELVEVLALAVVEAVLVLAGDADDHRGHSPLAACSALPEAIWGAGWEPEPSSLLSFARSSSTAGWLESSLSWRSMSSSPEPIWVMSSKVPAASSSRHRVGAGAHVFGLVHRPLHRQADVGHLLADAGGGLGDPDLGLGGGVLRLDDLLLGAEGFDLGAQFLLGVGELFLLLLEFGDLRVEPLELGLGDVLAFQGGAGEVFVAAGQRLAGLRVELHDALLQRALLHLQALLGGHHVGDPLLDVLQLFDLLLVAVVQRLGWVFGAVQQLRDLGLDHS